ncbi:MAG: Fic family protein [Candidatus Omnitrophica bacterium]|nr:Fic family protein [Candidatus Omnitrophota bacterium]
MVEGKKGIFPDLTTHCCDIPLPEKGHPAGYAALIEGYGLTVPRPRTLTAIGSGSRISERDCWRIFTSNYQPESTLEGHLTFALKHEGLDLAILKRVFQTVGPRKVEEVVRAKPSGAYARRIWFLYEWLLGKELDLSGMEKRSYVSAVDPKMQVSAPGKNSTRHGVRNNLPGTPDFCPMVFRTRAIEEFLAMGLRERAESVVDRTPRDLVNRAAAFMLLNDSRSSFEIEGENVSRDRIQRWSQVIGEAGRQPLTLDELIRLQKIVIGDERFVRIGVREDGVFVGEHDRADRTPIPDHIGARPEDIIPLLDGLIAFDQNAAQELDPVVAAALIGFGFIYVHPFEDGNGRIHRYLFHHTLAQRGFNPPGIVFPISSVILNRIDRYREVLEDYSKRLLPTIEWKSTDKGNVEVLNDTSDFYRFFDATPHVEFLYSCVQQAIDHDLPNETRFLHRFDAFKKAVAGIVDMPNRTFDLLFRFLDQNEGRLSKRAINKEFARLREEEVERIEDVYRDVFGIADQAGGE